jgi:hypothetical protein
MTQSKLNTKDRIAAFVALHNDPAYEPHPFDPFEDVPTRPRTRRFSLTRAIKHARKSGVDLTVEPNGAMTMRCSDAPKENIANPWDEVL